MWSVGAFLELDDRARLQQYIATGTDKTFQLDTPQLPPGSEETMFDYFVHDKTGAWTHWSTVVTEYVYPKDHDPEYASILVPNVDNVRTDFLIHTIAKQHKVEKIDLCRDLTDRLTRLCVACSAYRRARNREDGDHSIVHEPIQLGIPFAEDSELLLGDNPEYVSTCHRSLRGQTSGNNLRSTSRKKDDHIHRRQ